MAEAILSAENLHLSFGNVKALDDLSFKLHHGEILSIVGPNGSGKTSLLNCISGFYKPQKGKIFFKGIDITGYPPFKIAELGISRCFQGTGIYPRLTVAENIMSGAHIWAKNSKFGSLLFEQFITSIAGVKFSKKELELRRKAEEIIDFLELYPYRDIPAGALPVGIQKLVALGRALALEPKVLLLDEPSAGMSVQEKRIMARAIIEMNEIKDISIILVEHDLAFVRDLSHRMIVMAKGKKLAEGMPEEVIKLPEVKEAYAGVTE